MASESPAITVPLAAATRPSNLLLTPDPLQSPSSPSPTESLEQRHISDLFREHGLRLTPVLRQAVSEELSKLGVEYECVPSSSKGNKARKSPRPTHRRGSDSITANGLQRTIEVKLPSSNTTVTIPFIVKHTCDYIRQHIKQQGIFRISGVASRANSIMQRFTNPEIEEYFTSCDTVHDVAVVLKQYLRQLETPLIPYSIQHVFIQCLELQPESARTSALLLSSCLVPQETMGCLTYILQFLAEVAESSGENLMTFENLGIIMGLNIMPIAQDPRSVKSDNNKNSGKDVHKTERHVLDLHNKVIENLIKHADRVGRITEEVERRMDSLLSIRSSEDELENEGVGRRKKRRSGSLNRMLGFLKKVTSGKSGTETPITPMPHTPRGDSFSYTPVIKASARKNEDGVFSLQKKKNIFDGTARKSKNNELFGTPNTLPSQITCPSPAVCLDPSPMKMDWKTTPNGNRLRNFVTPGILRRRDKSSDNTDKNIFSAPTTMKSSKPRIRFGRSKHTKKQETPKQDLSLLKSKQTSASTISIHKLAASPRAATLQKNVSLSKIPRPGGGEKPAIPPKRVNLLSSSNITQLKKQGSKGSLNLGKKDEGDYVIISPKAEIDDADIRNEAFLASSSAISVATNNDSSSQAMTGNNVTVETDIDTTATTTELTKESDDPISHDSSSSTLQPPPMDMMGKLKLTPLIQEIDQLTRTAGDLTLSTLKGRKSASSIRRTRSRGHTLPESPTELETTPLAADQVESKFIKTLKESKIIQIQAEKINQTGMQLQRRLTIQERGLNKVNMSPSQRRIAASAKRRRSHEIGRVTPIITPTRFLSLRSPNASPAAASTTTSTLRRSPNRCTLKRGRPNTARVGLARPSPTRNTPRSVLTPPITRSPKKKVIPSADNNNPMKMEDNGEGSPTSTSPPPLPPRKDSTTAHNSDTPMRRMSSVQELVNKLEKNRKSKLAVVPPTAGTSENVESDLLENVELVLPSHQQIQPETDVISSPIHCSTTPQIVVTRSKARDELRSAQETPQTPFLFSLAPSMENDVDPEMNWVSGHKFKFDRKDFHNLKKSSDRDSIHFLKTLRAGKVPATVEYFNQIGHNKSPTKSLIPRYTGLQTQGTAKYLAGETHLITTPEMKSSNEDTPPVTTPSRIARRMSSVDIDIRNRNRKEELLDQIKKENAAVRRSNTTTGTGARGGRNLRPIERGITTNDTTAAAVPRTSSFKRPNTLDLKSPLTATCTAAATSSTTVIKPISRAASLRRPQTQTPRIVEEDESLIISVNLAIENLLHPRNENCDSVKKSGRGGNQGSASKPSPLKSSNLANSTTLSRNNSSNRKNSPSLKTSPPLRGINSRRRNVTITRTASETGTKSTTTTPRSTPKIKKALTTRAYDMMMMSGGAVSSPAIPMRRSTRTPNSASTNINTATKGTSNGNSTDFHSHAHACNTITPRRRVPRMGNGAVASSSTPHQLPINNFDGNVANSSTKSKLRTPLRATHLYTTPSH
ncbi:mucin-17 isoform X2 [Folsomia candida]|uniref:mucin-17 isoform X2 n=1 Tax=Folsomia candida TaxID=158441 RepID=UPI000B8F2397|nr:mucin-17 isoform X2 [Folsomia candida]